MLVAKSTADPQLSDDAERVDGFVRAIRPIAQVCVENFLVTVLVRDASLDSDLWHVSNASIALRHVACFERLDLLHQSPNIGARSAPKKPTNSFLTGAPIEGEPVAALPGRFE
jgi:hypothetical protein